MFAVEGTTHQLDFWRDKSGNARFFTPEQLKQTRAAMDLRHFFAQLASLLTLIEGADEAPADPSHISKNDSYIRIIKNDVNSFKKGQFGKIEFESALHRLYMNLKSCPDITLKELSLVGSTEKLPSTTLILGDTTQERLADALENPNDQKK